VLNKESSLRRDPVSENADEQQGPQHSIRLERLVAAEFIKMSLPNWILREQKSSNKTCLIRCAKSSIFVLFLVGP
jgi:hypothetical protein